MSTYLLISCPNELKGLYIDNLLVATYDHTMAPKDLETQMKLRVGESTLEEGSAEWEHSWQFPESLRAPEPEPVVEPVVEPEPVSHKALKVEANAESLAREDMTPAEKRKDTLAKKKAAAE